MPRTGSAIASDAMPISSVLAGHGSESTLNHAEAEQSMAWCAWSDPLCISRKRAELEAKAAEARLSPIWTVACPAHRQQWPSRTKEHGAKRNQSEEAEGERSYGGTWICNLQETLDSNLALINSN